MNNTYFTGRVTKHRGFSKAKCPLIACPTLKSMITVPAGFRETIPQDWIILLPSKVSLWGRFSSLSSAWFQCRTACKSLMHSDLGRASRMPVHGTWTKCMQSSACSLSGELTDVVNLKTESQQASPKCVLVSGQVQSFLSRNWTLLSIPTNINSNP